MEEPEYYDIFSEGKHTLTRENNTIYDEHNNKIYERTRIANTTTRTSYSKTPYRNYKKIERFRNNILSGLQETYQENNLIREQTYTDDTLQITRTYYPSGQLKGEYIETPNSEKAWYEDGTIWYELTHDNSIQIHLLNDKKGRNAILPYGEILVYKYSCDINNKNMLLQILVQLFTHLKCGISWARLRRVPPAAHRISRIVKTGPENIIEYGKLVKITDEDKNEHKTATFKSQTNTGTIALTTNTTVGHHIIYLNDTPKYTGLIVQPYPD